MTSPPAGDPRRRLGRFLSRISIRLLAFNVLLVFLPAAGLLYLGTYERQLLDAQERALVQQGRLLAAALAGRDRLDADEARRVLVQLDRRLDARLRVVDREGRLLADSSVLGPRREGTGEGEAAAAGGPRGSLLYRLGSDLNRLYRAVRPGPDLPAAEAGLYAAAVGGLLAGPAVTEALAGRYGADLRVSSGGAGPSGRAVTTLHCAIPVVDRRAGDGGGEVVGAVLVSQSTLRTLEALKEVRLGIFEVFLASVAAAVVLTLLVSTTIARPLRRLRDRAEAILDRRGRLKGRFGGSRKLDEIGDLERALAELTRRLEERMRFTEAFAADVSHEFKNPLASIRTAAEMLAESASPADRRRFETIILREVARLEHLLSTVREIATIDAGMEDEESRRVALEELVPAVVEGFRLRRRGAGGPTGAREGDGQVAIDVALPGAPVAVSASPERLSQVVENLLDNAIGFSRNGHAGGGPPRVGVELAVEGANAVVTVTDSGPGIPEEHRDRIFDRFFTYRPAEGGNGGGRRGGHAGLGLAIAKAIVEGYGGSIRAANRPEGGARFEVRLPLAG